MRTSDPAKREASVDADTSLLDETAGEYRPQAGPAHCEPDEAGCSGKEKTAKQAEVMRLHHSVSGDMIQVSEQMHFQVTG